MNLIRNNSKDREWAAQRMVRNPAPSVSIQFDADSLDPYWTQSDATVTIIDEAIDRDIREIISEGEPLYQEYLQNIIQTDREGDIFDAVVGYRNLYLISRNKKEFGFDDTHLDFIRDRLRKLTYFAHQERMYEMNDAPMGRLRIGRHFFRQVCCQKMYESIDADDVTVVPYEDSYTLSVRVDDPEHSGHANSETRSLTDECPYCGMELEFDDDFDIDSVTSFQEAMEGFYDPQEVDESTRREFRRREYEHYATRLPELLERSAEAEKEGRLKDALDAQFSILSVYIIGDSTGQCRNEAESCWEKITELKGKIMEAQLRLIDSHPYFRFILGTDGIERVCCRKMRDVLAGDNNVRPEDAPAAIAFITSPTFTFDPNDPFDLSRQFKERNCPFCGAEMELSEELKKRVDAMNKKDEQ